MSKPSSQVARHLHKYKKVNLSRTVGKDGKKEEYLVYKCIKPACSHYIPINLAEGKLCECNKCGEAMLITKAVLTHSGSKPMARPHCPNCIVRKNAKDVAALADFVFGTKTETNSD